MKATVREIGALIKGEANPILNRSVYAKASDFFGFRRDAVTNEKHLVWVPSNPVGALLYCASRVATPLFNESGDLCWWSVEELPELRASWKTAAKAAWEADGMPIMGIDECWENIDAVKMQVGILSAEAAVIADEPATLAHAGLN
jgi:hypothetical protein